MVRSTGNLSSVGKAGCLTVAIADKTGCPSLSRCRCWYIRYGSHTVDEYSNIGRTCMLDDLVLQLLENLFFKLYA